MVAGQSEHLDCPTNARALAMAVLTASWMLLAMVVTLTVVCPAVCTDQMLIAEMATLS